MDQNQQRRGHYNRGRRGPDRRGPDRRTPPPQAPEHGRDHVDVEQIMRDIRSRIAQRHGIDLSNQQIQELAARRLEAILDPRAIKPGLLDELRRSAGAPPPPHDPAEAAELTYAFEDTTLYESHRGAMRFIRRLLNPILKLFFNPNPLIHALNTQARWNAEAARREAERVRRQTEWNALHYELLHRMVTEVARGSIELHALSTQVESLSSKVDFNERRVRSMEGSQHQARPLPPPRGPEAAAAPTAAATPGAETPAVETPIEGQTQPSDSSRRRRRRRRGRRGSGAPGDGAPGFPQQQAQPGSQPDVSSDSGSDEGPDDDAGPDEGEVMATPVASVEPPLPVLASVETPVLLAAVEPPVLLSSVEPSAVASVELPAPPEAPAPIEHHVPEPVPPAPAPEERDPEA